MNKIIFIFMLLSTSAFAGTYRLVEYETPLRSGTEIYYYSANGNIYTVEEYYGEAREGYKPDPRFLIVTTNEVTVAIPQPIQNVAAAYKAAMEDIYGAGAVTNRALTRAAVAIDLSLRDDVSAETGLRLRAWFEILDEYWGRGEIWTFPYGQSTYTATNTTTTWKAEDDE